VLLGEGGDLVDAVEAGAEYGDVPVVEFLDSVPESSSLDRSPGSAFG
jgi:hypothetical protein